MLVAETAPLLGPEVRLSVSVHPACLAAKLWSPGFVVDLGRISSFSASAAPSPEVPLVLPGVVNGRSRVRSLLSASPTTIADVIILGEERVGYLPSTRKTGALVSEEETGVFRIHPHLGKFLVALPAFAHWDATVARSRPCSFAVGTLEAQIASQVMQQANRVHPTVIAPGHHTWINVSADRFMAVRASRDASRKEGGRLLRACRGLHVS